MKKAIEYIRQIYMVELNDHWSGGKWSLEKCAHYPETPEVHFHIAGFLNTVKAILDLLAQLLKTENVVGAHIHGFHKEKNIAGGNVINALTENVVDGKNPIASQLMGLISSNKTAWIDELISIRDALTHPKKGFGQLMFELELQEIEGKLELITLRSPKIDGDYVKRRFDQLETFVSDFLSILTQN